MYAWRSMSGSDGGTPRLLVTGATGFIGGRLVAAALARGFAVRALVRDAHLAAGLEPAELFQGDLTDPPSLAGVEQGVDLVVHCAGILGKWGTPESVLHEVNVQGTVSLLERFRDEAPRLFVHLSAGGVTGPVPRRVVDESYACRPATAFEKSKWLGERHVLEASPELGVPAVVLRPTFTYGPGDPHKLALFRAVRRGRFAFIGDGESVVHPVYVDDLLNGIFLALERARPGQVYIVGGERPVTKRELIHAIADAQEVRRPALRIPRPLASAAAAVLETLGRTLGFEPLLTRSRVMMMADNFGYTIDKARAELGYRPEVSLTEGIGRTARAYAEAGRL